MSASFTQCPGDTVQTGTGKVDPARKFKCTAAARDEQEKRSLHFLQFYKSICQMYKTTNSRTFLKPHHFNLRKMATLITEYKSKLFFFHSEVLMDLWTYLKSIYRKRIKVPKILCSFISTRYFFYITNISLYYKYLFTAVLTKIKLS